MFVVTERLVRLILYGDHEVFQGKRQGREMSETLEEGSVKAIPDAGHLANQDSPEVFNTACTEFFAGLATTDELVVSD